MAAEPWLSGSHTEVHPVLRAVLHSFDMALEDIGKAVEGLSTEQVWARPGGVASVGFHIRHIGRSCDRLFTYALGQQLRDRQLAALEAEGDPGASIDSLLSELHNTLYRLAEAVQLVDPSRLTEPRAVGRSRLPSTLAGLLVHMAEHTQRHVGQLVTTARLAKSGPV
jgi:uncharacterized damage-inducible protein DinB